MTTTPATLATEAFHVALTAAWERIATAVRAAAQEIARVFGEAVRTWWRQISPAVVRFGSRFQRQQALRRARLATMRSAYRQRRR